MAGVRALAHRWCSSVWRQKVPLALIDQKVQVTPQVGLQDVLGVEALIAAKGRRGPGWGFGGPTSQLLLVDQQIESAADGVEHDLIAVADESDGTTDSRFRGDV